MLLSLVKGSTFGLMPFGKIGFPVGPFGCDARMVLGSSDGGPCASVKTARYGLEGLSDWLASTGTFWVTLCPNETPKTPTSYDRPYPARTTVFGVISYAMPNRGAKCVSEVFTFPCRSTPFSPVIRTSPVARFWNPPWSLPVTDCGK